MNRGASRQLMRLPSRMKFSLPLRAPPMGVLLAGALVWNWRANAWARICEGQVFAT
jgi:hypothetical protein